MAYTETEKEARMKMIRKLQKEGKSYNEISRTVGVAESTVSGWLRQEGVILQGPKNRNKIEYDVDRLRELAEKGYSLREIGEEMFVSGTTVRLWLKEHGIEIDQEKKRERLRKRNAKQLSVKKQKKPKKKCKTCQYRSDKSSTNGCDYAWLTGTCRRCPVIGCTKYVKGKRLKKRQEIA